MRAIAVCKLVLKIQPEHADTLRRLAVMNQQIGQGPTRTASMAEHNLALHDSPNVAAIRRNSGTMGDGATIGCAATRRLQACATAGAGASSSNRHRRSSRRAR